MSQEIPDITGTVLQAANLLAKMDAYQRQIDQAMAFVVTELAYPSSSPEIKMSHNERQEKLLEAKEKLEGLTQYIKNSRNKLKDSPATNLICEVAETLNTFIR